jgi:hypothetical protein
VVPWTPNGATDNKALHQRSTVVRAFGADREDLATTAHQQNRLTVCMSEQLAVVRKFRLRDPCREIRPTQLIIRARHSCPSFF